MGTLAWLFVLGVGIVVSFVAGRLSAPRTARLKNLERERDSATGELRRYQEEVNSHFEKTGKLFDQLTGDYRSLYEHLADGATRLGLSDHGNVLQAEPEQRKLTGAAEGGDDKPGGAAAAAAGAGVAAAAASAQSASSEPPAGDHEHDADPGEAEQPTADEEKTDDPGKKAVADADESLSVDSEQAPVADGADTEKAAEADEPEETLRKEAAGDGEDTPDSIRPPSDYPQDERKPTSLH